MAPDASLAVLLHSSRYDRIYQAAAVLASACSMGWRCHLFLFYGALDAFVKGGWEEHDLIDRGNLGESDSGGEAPEVVERIVRGFELSNMMTPNEMIASARTGGNLTVYACSASMKVLGLDADEVRSRVDEIVGIPTVLQIVSKVAHALYI